MARLYRDTTNVREWSGGLAMARQEDEARATDAERQDDERYANDYAVIVDLLVQQRQRSQTRERFHVWVCQVLNRGAILATDHAFAQFRDDYGDSAAYRAVAKALEQQP